MQNSSDDSITSYWTTAMARVPVLTSTNTQPTPEASDDSKPWEMSHTASFCFLLHPLSYVRKQLVGYSPHFYPSVSRYL